MILENTDTLKFTFSGHDSFQCRQLWLKKGYDFVYEGRSFNDEDAVVKLGVGKNMVSAIRYWMKAFNIINSKDVLTDFGDRMFNDETGYDPYLEDEASLWLLHYQLVKTRVASIYHVIFNDFRKEKILFSREIFLNYLKRVQELNTDLTYNENTVAKDFNVFVNMYKSADQGTDIEDSFSGILSEIGLLKSYRKSKEEQFQIENSERDKLPAAVILFTILDNSAFGNSISLNSLEFDIDSPGSVFALNHAGLVNKVTEISGEYKDVIYTDHAGIKQLQFKNKLAAFSILDTYYGK